MSGGDEDDDRRRKWIMLMVERGGWWMMDVGGREAGTRLEFACGCGVFGKGAQACIEAETERGRCWKGPAREKQRGGNVNVMWLCIYYACVCGGVANWA